MHTKKTIIFIDSGDTIVDESTQIFDDAGNVLRADFIPGADEMLKSLYDSGHTLALVADGRIVSFENIFRENGCYSLFQARIYSEALKVEKPHPLMFQKAMEALGLEEQDKRRIIMVGNNLARDVKGANDFGITSVHLSWTPRYPKQPENESEIADYTIAWPLELIDLVSKMDAGLLPMKTR